MLLLESRITKTSKKDIFEDVLTSLKTKYQRVILDLKFIKTCKKEELVSTFANVRLSVKHGSAKLKKRTSRIIMESEMQVKYQENKKLKQEIKALNTQLKIVLPTLVYTTLLHRINVAVKRRIKSIAKRHERKLSKLENINIRVISSVVSKSVKMPYTLWHLIMD